MTTTAQPNEPRMADPEDVEVRYQRLAELVVHGASRADLIDMAMRRWQVSRRTAEAYAQTVRERLVGESACTDRLFYLTLSQLQRDQLVGLALRYTMNTTEHFDPQVMQSLSAMITAVRGLLDSRDRAAAEIHQLVEEQLGAAKKLTAATASKNGDNGSPDSSSPRVARSEQDAKGVRVPSGPANGKHPTTPLPPAVLKRMAEAAATRRKSNDDNTLQPDAGASDSKAPAARAVREDARH